MFSMNNLLMRSRTLSFLLIAALVTSSSFLLTSRVIGQVRPVYDYGELGLQQAIRRLNTTASVMMIGAHPDDEDSGLLAYLARGENARTSYLSLTRGDGGQNIIGPELFEALGVIRTEELLKARRLDGAEQYFTRAFDYGFSKTLDEAKQKWPVDVIKCDMVRAIRQFKPQVVISAWSGTPGDGHGQHQYSGYISPIAVAAAADASQCTDAGPAWQVLKFYVERGSSSQPTLRINVGKFDPLLGRSYFEIAMEGRSQHRSQGEGRLELRGDQFSTLTYVSGTVPKGTNESSVFDGIDTRPPWGQVGSSASLSDLVALARRIPENSFARKDLNEAIAHLAGIQIDVLSDRETVSPGESVGVGVKVYIRNAPAAKVTSVEWLTSTGLELSKAQPPDNSAAFTRRENASYSEYFQASVSSAAEPTQPYWLRSQRKGEMFDWPTDRTADLPFQPPVLTARVNIDLAGTSIEFDEPVQYRFADPARGEIRRDLNVVPPMSVAAAQDLLVVPTSTQPQSRTLDVIATKNVCKPIQTDGELTIRGTAPGWAAAPVASGGDLAKCGDRSSSTFKINIPGGAKPGTYTFTAQIEGKGFSWGQTMNTVAYPHIQTHRFYTPAQTRVLVLDLQTAPVNVGYIMGSGDQVPGAIRQMGLNVTMIDDLAKADLSKFDSIVVGIRASEVRPDFAANNNKLLEWVRSGGNLIVQYQRPAFAQQDLAPFPFNMADTQRTAAGSTSRVVDENAPVKILQPDSPVFNFPNKITDTDFNGWIQERNLYNWVTYDSQYTPLLESHDPGEQPNNGGMVIANLGKGTYIYTSYSWFRQLPAGVPGAYRIFANLLSLPRAQKKP
jgi:LmbE family N-acetylglucosaminyl deacetylase